jgi:hypothetical protein
MDDRGSVAVGTESPTFKFDDLSLDRFTSAHFYPAVADWETRQIIPIDRVSDAHLESTGRSNAIDTFKTVDGAIWAGAIASVD